MYKIRNFIDKEVYLVTGKKVGVVNGLLINLKDKKVETLLISRFGFLKNKYVSCDDIVSISSKIIVCGLSIAKGIDISSILLKDVYNKDGVLRGNVSDILISEKSLNLEGLICYRGIRNKIKEGNIIIPVNEVILGEDYVLDIGNGNITFNSVIHKAKEEMLNENSK